MVLGICIPSILLILSLSERHLEQSRFVSVWGGSGVYLLFSCDGGLAHLSGEDMIIVDSFKHLRHVADILKVGKMLLVKSSIGSDFLPMKLVSSFASCWMILWKNFSVQLSSLGSSRSAVNFFAIFIVEDSDCESLRISIVVFIIGFCP